MPAWLKDRYFTRLEAWAKCLHDDSGLDLDALMSIVEDAYESGADNGENP